MRRLIFVIGSFTWMLMPVIVSAAALTPSTMELSGARGQTINGSFTIINTQASEQEYFLGIMGFAPKDDSGSPQFLSSSDGLSKWISFPSRSIVVPAQSRGDVPFTVVIPNDIASGGYYAAITVSPAPADIVASNSAIIEAKTATLVFLTVEGNTVESLVLMDFTSSGERIDLPFADFHFRAQNQGNIHVTPKGTVTLTGMFGQTIARFDANPAEGRVLPASTRAFDVDGQLPIEGWLNTAAYQLRHLTIGPVTAMLDLTYGESGRIRSSMELWVIPWQLLVTMVVVALMILAPMGWGRKRLLRRP